MTIRNKLILDIFSSSYPNAKCSLVFSSPFQCVVAVSLSAQTTDKAVNLVTPKLFSLFPDPYAFSKADIKEIELIIRSIGLYKNKAKNLLEMSKVLVNKYDGQVPSNLFDLVSLPGVGIKTASVVLAECFKVPSFPVDTHCKRVLTRLGIAKEKDTPIEVMEKAKKAFPKESWINLHHQIIEHGRTICHARKPLCKTCPFSNICKSKENAHQGY